MKREKTKTPGVYQLISEVRRHDGKADICYYYTFKDALGKKVWRKVGWRSEGYSMQIAADMRAKAVRAMRDGTGIDSAHQRSTALTVAEGWAIFDAKWLSTSIKRPEDERKRYTRYVESIFAHRRMDAVTIVDLHDFKSALLAKPLSGATVRLILGDLRRMYRKLIELDIYTGPDPTIKLAMPNTDNARTRFLTPQEADRLLRDLATRSPTWHDIALCSLHTGMRLSEVLNLEVQDIDMQTRCIRVRDGKTGSRTVYMTTPVHSMLAERMPTRVNARIFTGRDGLHLTPLNASKSFSRAVAACGLNPAGTDTRNRVCFHTLRHTYCSWLAMSGTPLYTISEMVGHSTTDMTRRYAHLCPSAAKGTATSIEAMILGINPLSEHGEPPENP